MLLGGGQGVLKVDTLATITTNSFPKSLTKFLIDLQTIFGYYNRHEISRDFFSPTLTETIKLSQMWRVDSGALATPLLTELTGLRTAHPGRA